MFLPWYRAQRPEILWDDTWHRDSQDGGKDVIAGRGASHPLTPPPLSKGAPKVSPNPNRTLHLTKMLFTSFCRCEKFQFSTCWQHLFRGDCGHFFTCEIPHFYILRRCQTGSEKRSLEGLLKMSSPLSSNVFQMWKRRQAPNIQCFSDVEKMSSPLPSNVFHMWRRFQAPPTH